jgi:hypothetical protein
MVFGKGKTLRQHSPYLRNSSERAKRIIDAAERNNMIEGLPKFTKKQRVTLSRKIKKA